jgi:hypothetical protein
MMMMIALRVPDSCSGKSAKSATRTLYHSSANAIGEEIRLIKLCFVSSFLVIKNVWSQLEGLTFRARHWTTVAEGERQRKKALRTMDYLGVKQEVVDRVCKWGPIFFGLEPRQPNTTLFVLATTSASNRPKKVVARILQTLTNQVNDGLRLAFGGDGLELWYDC